MNTFHYHNRKTGETYKVLAELRKTPVDVHLFTRGYQPLYLATVIKHGYFDPYGKQISLSPREGFRQISRRRYNKLTKS